MGLAHNLLRPDSARKSKAPPGVSFSVQIQQACKGRGMAASASKVHVEVVQHPLSLERYTGFVQDDGAGAIATFTGVTRDNFNGKRVVRLDYEAYAPMAEKKLQARTMLLALALRCWPFNCWKASRWQEASSLPSIGRTPMRQRGNAWAAESLPEFAASRTAGCESQSELEACMLLCFSSSLGIAPERRSLRLSYTACP